ncbi:MAG: DUF4143 domain-containing protein [Propionibacteriaceae bacterium]|nr:DUF4143 domain-containing protein [Propionibacteriaceae bacterium]
MSPAKLQAWLLAGGEGNPSDADDLPRLVVQGGFPERLKRGSGRRVDRWFADYVLALAQHDAAEISDGPFADQLTSTLRWLAAQGQTELVKAKLARHLGVSQTTADPYLRLIWRMFLGRTYPSWGVGYAGRETRRPKVSLLDTGLACHLTGFTADQASAVGGRGLSSMAATNHSGSTGGSTCFRCRLCGGTPDNQDSAAPSTTPVSPAGPFVGFLQERHASLWSRRPGHGRPGHARVRMCSQSSRRVKALKPPDSSAPG